MKTLKINTYSYLGKKLESVSLPKNWTQEPNMQLLAQAVRVYKSNSHVGKSKTKTRSEIVATKKKIYRQKGTGGARHGAKSAPIFVGGSKAHGPKGVKRVLSLPLKMRKKALESAISYKVHDNKLVLVKGLEKLAKTKESQKLVDAIKKDLKVTKAGQKLTFVLSRKSKDAKKSIRNLSNTKVSFVDELNAYSVFLGGLLIFDTQTLKNDKN